MERVKEGGRGGEGKKETPAEKPLNFENQSPKPISLENFVIDTTKIVIPNWVKE